MSYLPDFLIENPDGTIEYHEVKGWMTQKGRTALNRMARYYPDVVVKLIDGKVYRGIAARVAPLIPMWEKPGKRSAATVMTALHEARNPVLRRVVPEQPKRRGRLA